MPPKRRKGGATKGGAAKGKAKGKKGAAAAAEKEEMVRRCRNFLRIYQQGCTTTRSIAPARICRDCRAAIENEKPLAKFVLEPSQPSKPPARGPAASRPQVQRETPQGQSLVETAVQAPPILLRPLTAAWLETKYSYVRSLHVWKVELLDDSIVQLALFLESPLSPHLQVLELMDNKLSSWSIERLASSLRTVSQLSVIKLDYNHLLPPALASLCEALQANPQLHTLSLNYCHMVPSCGESLGNLAALSHIREMSLRGNTLECEGASELIRPVVALCESGEFEKPPPLAKLDLRDNGMDGCGVGCGNTFVPVICMRVFKRWIVSSPSIEELQLDGNLIGDGGARELVLAMQGRKEVGLPDFRMTMSPRTSQELFTATLDLSVSRKKGKKKGRKGKKKK